MKKLLTLLALSFILTNGFSQQLVSNGDFENWENCTVNSISSICPVDWTMQFEFHNQVSPGYNNSNYALRLFCTTTNSVAGRAYIPVKLSSRVTEFSFYYMGNVMPKDENSVAIYVFSNKKQIGFGNFTNRSTQSTYKRGSVTINYSGTETPDSAYVTVFGADDIFPVSGTDFTVDNFEYTDVATAVNSIENNIKEMSIFPAPANDAATLRFTLQKSTGVTIEVFDILGKKVKAVLQDEPKQAGFQNINIDLSELDNGIYFTSIKTSDGSSITKKLIISK